jgi:cysteine desulfurase/selenocysteine lyase
LGALRRLFPALDAADTAYFNSAYTSLTPEPALRAAREAAIARYSRTAADIERVRAQAAAFLHAAPAEIRFVPGTTQGLAMVAKRLRLGAYDRVVLSAAEHRANREPWGRHRMDLARLDASGNVNWEMLEARLKGARVLAVAHASNVTGELAPLARLAATARREGALVVVDAAQSAPQVPLDVRTLGADVLLFSGHKAWGLTGVGVLWARPEVLAAMEVDRPAIEDGLPYEAIEALGAGLAALAASRTPALDDHRRALSARLDAGLRALSGVRMLGPTALSERVPLFAISGPGRELATIGDLLRRQGIHVRVGQHHAEPLHASLGLTATLRVSAHTYNTLDEADRLIAALEAAWRL